MADPNVASIAHTLARVDAAFDPDDLRDLYVEVMGEEPEADTDLRAEMVAYLNDRAAGY